MAERSSLTQTVQWGVEVSGAPTTGGILMSAMGFDPSPQVSGGDFRPAGQKFKTLAWVGKEWSEGSISGQLTYTEILFPLASVMSLPTTSANGTGGAYDYTFVMDPSGPDDPRTFTIEHGEDGNWNKITNVIFKELGMSFDRDQIQLTGSAYGRATEVQATDMTTVDQTPSAILVLPADLSVYWGTSYATITGSPTGAYSGTGGGKLTRVMSTEFSIGNRFNPLWVLDRAQESYAASVEAEPELTAGALVEANTQGMTLMTDLQQSNTRYIRIEGVSSQEAATGVPYKITIDMAVKVNDTDGYSDEEGAFAIGWNMMGINDATIGGPLKIVVTTNLAPSAYPGLLTPGAS